METGARRGEGKGLGTCTIPSLGSGLRGLCLCLWRNHHLCEALPDVM